MGRMSDQALSVTEPMLRQWTMQARIPGDLPDFSDQAALLIAAGYLNRTGREALVRRIAEGRAVPLLPDGYCELRRTQRAIVTTAAKLDNPVLPGVFATVLRSRLAGHSRRRENARRIVVGGKGVFPTGSRAIKRERRAGVFLEVTERELLFGGLLCTPTPNATASLGVRSGKAVDKFLNVVGSFSGKPGSAWSDVVGEQRPAAAVATGGMRVAVFVDGYETLLYLAGYYYDRIRHNAAWRSDHFSLQRSQLDLDAELADIAADVVALRSLRIDLDNARARGAADAGFVAHLDSREAELRPVWSELIRRVHALIGICETVESLAGELRILDEFDRAASIDSRIDGLLARSGTRELSADHSELVREQLRSGEEQLRIYRDVLQGNLTRLEAPAPLELPQRYEPEQ